MFAWLALILLVMSSSRAVFGEPVAGWPSLVCLILFIGGSQMLCLGVFGQYLAKSYVEVKNRPIYVVRESNLD